jgi:hypothetical protein
MRRATDAYSASKRTVDATTERHREAGDSVTIMKPVRVKLGQQLSREQVIKRLNQWFLDECHGDIHFMSMKTGVPNVGYLKTLLEGKNRLPPEWLLHKIGVKKVRESSVRYFDTSKPTTSS